MIKKYVIFVLAIITSCSSSSHWWKPNGYLFTMMPKGGSPGFNLGWVHGCQSGLGTQFAGAIGMTFYTWSRDVDITSTKPNIQAIRERYGKKELKDVNWNDPKDIKQNFSDYNLVFFDAYNFCRQTALGSLRASIGNPPLPNQTRYDPSDSNVGDIWKLDGGYDSRIGTTGYW